MDVNVSLEGLLALSQPVICLYKMGILLWKLIHNFQVIITLQYVHRVFNGAYLTLYVLNLDT